MPAKKRATADAVNVDHVPLYDPAVHTQPEQMVFAEMYCTCGSLRRWRDPVAVITNQVADFTARHSGDGHGPVSKADCVAEQETRREAAFRAVGMQDAYVPRERPNLDAACTQARPWPALLDTDVAG